MKSQAVSEPLFSKEELIQRFREIKIQGWIKSTRNGHAAVGGTLEDLLGIKENNLPIPNASDWELKARQKPSSSLITLFHMEPAPLGSRIVPALLLPNYGWKHKEAGRLYPATEMSFRSTIGGKEFTDRGFKVIVDRQAQKVKVVFDHSKADSRHSEWLKEVQNKAGLDQFDPEPYYGFNDLMYKAGSKLKNCFYAQAKGKTVKGEKYFWYDEFEMLTGLNFDGFLNCIEQGKIFVDFDARTGHNHGVKFRIKQNIWPDLYKNCKKVV